MKIKVHRSKISTKPFRKFSFPRYSSEDLKRQSDSGIMPPVTKLSLEKAPVIYSSQAVIGFYTIKNFQEITGRMRPDPEKFGKCLNRFITTYSEIVLSENGEIGKFSGVGALFAFKAGSKPRECVQKAVISALRMRYILNKLNRGWNFYRGDAWNVGIGLSYGKVTFQEHHEDGIKYVSITGKPWTLARGIGQSASSNQIIITESMYLQFPFLETSFDVKPPRHVPVQGENYTGKIREIVGMVGPQAKAIYEEYV